jgi:hypothetical protein
MTPPISYWRSLGIVALGYVAVAIPAFVIAGVVAATQSSTTARYATAVLVGGISTLVLAPLVVSRFLMPRMSSARIGYWRVFGALIVCNITSWMLGHVPIGPGVVLLATLAGLAVMARIVQRGARPKPRDRVSGELAFQPPAY